MQLNCIKVSLMQNTCIKRLPTMNIHKLISYSSLAVVPLGIVRAEVEETLELAAIETLEPVVVTANRFGQTVFEQIPTANVLSGKDFLINREATLGQMLRREPGVSAEYFAPAASRPVIRGLGGDRIRILQNGASLIDISAVSPDHAVMADPLNLSKVEVIRGPASLLYGPNTIGGLVSVFDSRIAEEVYDRKSPTVTYDFSAGSNDNSISNSGSVTWGTGPVVLTFDAFRRNAENVEIPGFARSARERANNPLLGAEASGFVPNSFNDSEGLGFGASYIFENGFIGASVSGIDSNYGTIAEPDVTIGLEQRRVESRGAIYDPSPRFREINYKFGYSDYSHTEFEGTEVGTIFETEGFNFRVEALNTEIAGFEGTIGYEGQFTEFSALGAEAFVPATSTNNNSIFFLQEKDFGKVRFQFGARYDRQESESETNPLFGAGQKRNFNAFSASVGATYNPTEDYALTGTLAYTQRPPTYVELFADGPHVATGTFEVGDVDLGKEEAFSIDLSARKRAGRVTGSVNAFYYRFSDYINLTETGMIDDGLPVFAFQGVNADFYGGEIEATFHLFSPVEPDPNNREGYTQDDSRLDFTLRADYVRAKDRDNGDSIPRMPPFRAGFDLEYENGPFTASIDGQYSAKQNKTADFETPTDSFFLLGAGLSYQTTIADIDSTFYIRGVNLTDEEARLSTSFLKDISPLAGRGVVVGFRGTF